MLQHGNGRAIGTNRQYNDPAAMRLIDRYICKEVFSHALLGLLIFTFVIFVPRLVMLMTLVVRQSGSPERLALLLLCTFPFVLTFTLPMAVLVGVLIGLGRMSADSELIAISALGIGLRRVLVPVGALAGATAMITLAITLWVGPAAQRTFHKIQDELTTSQASYAVQPHIFEEFPHLVLYVNDVNAAASNWRGVFLSQQTEKGSELTVAQDAVVVTDRARGTLELHLHNGSVHEFDPANPNQYQVQTFGESDWPIPLSGLSASPSSPIGNTERSLTELRAAKGPEALEARVEIQRRFAFPVACLVFALLAVPLAARPRRGGRAMGLIVSLLLVCGYYLLFIIGNDLARQGKLPATAGIWTANFVTGLAGLALLPGMEQIRSANWLSDLGDHISNILKDLLERLHGGRRRYSHGRPEVVPSTTVKASGSSATVEKARVLKLRPVEKPRERARHRWGFPQMLDLYLLKNFCAYFLLVMVGFIVLFEIFTFFELLDNIARHHTPFIVVADYFRYLIPYLVYHLSPFAVLVAAMITLGVMSKNNEIVAFKASGVSLYRLSWPVIGAAAVLAFSLLVLDNTYLPYCNQRQDALLNEIKGRPPQTYLHPNRSWIFGTADKIYNYQLFDPDRNLFGELNVFEIDPKTFQLRRRVYAERALWSPETNAWLLEDGWIRDFQGSKIGYTPFQADTVAELTEPPSYFNREVRQSDQMSWRELDAYIRGLQQAGFEVGRLSVQWHEKLAFPMIAPIIAFLAIPFAFYVGTRGAVGGLALGVGIGIAYWAASALFEAVGGVGQLPPLIAGWAPDAIFICFGTYFFLKMPT
jgi:LPS export ABC transporter permease LptF/LPS export ABC transporter permease LptG